MLQPDPVCCYCLELWYNTKRKVSLKKKDCLKIKLLTKFSSPSLRIYPLTLIWWLIKIIDVNSMYLPLKVEEKWSSWSGNHHLPGVSPKSRKKCVFFKNNLLFCHHSLWRCGYLEQNYLQFLLVSNSSYKWSLRRTFLISSHSLAFHSDFICSNDIHKTEKNREKTPNSHS